MRCKITVRKVSPSPVDFDYQYGMASMLYMRLANVNVNLADKTHSHKGFKFYTFSNLVIENRKPNKLGLDFTKAHFFISSPDIEFIKCFAKGLLTEPEFFLKSNGKNKHVNFIIESIEILPEISFSNICVFKTLSPIYIKTKKLKSEKLIEIDLYPKDVKFYENLHKNLVERYEEFYKHGIEHEHFNVINIDDFKPKRVLIGNSYRRCSLMKLTIESNQELIEFAYDAGLGEKNAMGFGCVDVVEK